MTLLPSCCHYVLHFAFAMHVVCGVARDLDPRVVGALHSGFIKHHVSEGQV